MTVVFCALLTLAIPGAAKDRWTELNIGPFYLTTDGDPGAARDFLTQLEQLRWVLGSLLEIKDLPSVWPIRILLTAQPAPANASAEFTFRGSQYLLVVPPGSPPPLAQTAGLLLDTNTPRLPAAVESGLRQLFSTLEAHGSRVTWGGPPAHPDLDWARMQLFATKFEYGASFHIFLTALRGGSTLAAAERNAFGRPSADLENEAKAKLAAGKWSQVPVSGRPLNPKRDFGEHSFNGMAAEVTLADAFLPANAKAAEATDRSAISAGGTSAILGYEGLAQSARLRSEDPKVYWEDAIRAGSHNAFAYLSAAEDLPESEALPLLKKAALLNDRWADPIYRQAQLAQAPAEKESLLKAALKLNPRATLYWIELARLQTEAGEGTAAQGSWLRAEDSAPSDIERDRVHQLRMASEQQRINASEEARRRDREAPHLADQQAEDAQSERVRAAERKANESLDNASPGEKPSDAVAWDSLAGAKKFTGTLVRVDCLAQGWRLSVKDKAGASTQLFLSKDSGAALACGVQSPPRRVAIEYHALPDEELHTVGQINRLQLQ